MVGGVGNGLVEAETLLGGEEAVAFVARPFRRSFMRSDAYPKCAVSIVLVPVQVVNVIFCRSHKDDGR